MAPSCNCGFWLCKQGHRSVISFDDFVMPLFLSSEFKEILLAILCWNEYNRGNGEKGGEFHLTLQEQVVQKVSALSDDHLQFLLELIERFMQPVSVENTTVTASKRIGIAKGQILYDDDYDFDEMNPEIEKIFGGIE